ncbi:MAG: hypothetical protein LBO80_02545 [Treponema sp.]|jgi:hypothetical protein|nr:hypothetical protein [Treponema sp.]
MKGRLFSGALLAFLLAGCAGLGGTQTLRGTVRIYGNEPHTYAAIESGGRVYGVYPPGQERELRKLQGREAEFKVRPLDAGAPPPFCDSMVSVLSWKLLH